MCLFGNLRVKDFLGVHPKETSFSLKYLSVMVSRHLSKFLLFTVIVLILILVLLFKNNLNFSKCDKSFTDNESSILLFTEDTLPSANKNPNQYAFSSVSIQSKTVLSNFNML